MTGAGAGGGGEIMNTNEEVLSPGREGEPRQPEGQTE